MKPLILLAAAALPVTAPAPAVAQPPSLTLGAPPFGPGAFGSRHDHPLRRGVDSTVIVYDRADSGDSAFRRDGFNDWWHSDPARAFPRWMSNNQGCQRQWWSGGGWTC